MGNSSLADAKAFRDAAATGQLGIDPDAAQTVLNKIRAGKDAVESLVRNADHLATGPKLGANVVGNAMSDKVSQRAEGGDDSYAQALRSLYDQYDQAEQAIITAMSQYQQFDQDSADSLAGNA